MSLSLMQDEVHESVTLDSPMPDDRAAQEGPPPKLRRAEGGVAVSAGSCTFRQYYRCAYAW